MHNFRHVFHPENIRLVHEVIAGRPLGLAIDIDGTISEISSSPSQAFVDEAIKRSLRTLARQLKMVATISGRPAAECRCMVGIDDLLYLGNHGLERWQRGSVKVRPDAEQYKQIIAASLKNIAQQISIEGTVFENKGVVGAIHFRNTRQPEIAREAIILAITKSESANGLKVTEGKMVIELRPPVEVDKGTALRELVDEHGLAGIFYVGDDLTDVDAFLALCELREAKALRALSIAVLGDETPSEVLENADLVLRGVSEVERFLLWLSQEVGATPGD